AINDKKGLFQEADGGTIFLDEVSSMSPMLQSRLLRVLQEREVRRVGDNTPFYVNVRVVAAANEPLEKRIKEGTFREDLFYRLNVIPIELPSLRERREDIPLLVAHFLNARFQRGTNQPFQVTRQAMDLLCAYDWPGNVRELENAIERAATLCDGGLIQAKDLPPNVLASVKAAHPNLDVTLDGAATAELPVVPESALYPLRANNHPASGSIGGEAQTQPLIPLKSYLREQEQAYLNRVLQQCGGDKERAAI